MDYTISPLGDHIRTQGSINSHLKICPAYGNSQVTSYCPINPKLALKNCTINLLIVLLDDYSIRSIAYTWIYDYWASLLVQDLLYNVWMGTRRKTGIYYQRS